MVVQIIILVAIVLGISLYFIKLQDAKLQKQREREESFLVPKEGGVL